jgi:hypothetical protein
MKNFKTIFKTKAQAKALTSADMLALCIYRTIKAKSEDKAVILDYFIKKAFTAGAVRSDRPYPYHAVSNAQYTLKRQSRPGRKWTGEKFEQTSGNVLGEPINELFDENEVIMFRELLATVEHYGYKGANK